jgi:hypothetical protein
MLKSWQVLVKMRTHDGSIAIRLRMACVSAYAVARRDAMHTASTAQKKLPKIAAVSFLVRPAPESKDRSAHEVNS